MDVKHIKGQKRHSDSNMNQTAVGTDFEVIEESDGYRE